MTALEFAKNVVSSLETKRGAEWVDFWFESRLKFIHLYNSHYVFSTRITGADFFERVTYHLENKTFLQSEENGKLGHYDCNFNKWLKEQFNS